MREQEDGASTTISHGRLAATRAVDSEKCDFLGIFNVAHLHCQVYQQPWSRVSAASVSSAFPVSCDPAGDLERDPESQCSRTTAHRLFPLTPASESSQPLLILEIHSSLPLFLALYPFALILLRVYSSLSL